MNPLPRPGPWTGSPPRRAATPVRRTLAAVLALCGATLPLAAAAAPPGVEPGSLEAATARPSGVEPSAYRAPLDGAVHVERAFDLPAAPWLPGHRGIDLATVTGATVRAPADGVVVFAGPVAGRGVLSVLHGDGRRSSLEPIRSEVSVGSRVRAGDPLGTVDGHTHGHPRTAPVLHWGVRDGEEYVDPWALLPGRGPVVLLPVP
ncbi:Peptidase M23 [Cellulomonas flavigena DSM 20109]|uniref:Peptidase M23 n=1 Tax=Cellulomonas flavigena (strain ATCC 482 / DSM 20109 / BCRC 11376 / JCM 18109 / NBRC 3775 / NCIMB 8073 / NRS 134) TaxID=446466 RepID=D5UD44_CELFN|nr:M23 family metallopeptidase [Cellulomonas flavigena]ADG74381.1 Peptidase M23 [Cellulomonas flavigena DSM 20109]